jgi:hypothetical protein
MSFSRRHSAAFCIGYRHLRVCCKKSLYHRSILLYHQHCIFVSLQFTDILPKEKEKKLNIKSHKKKKKRQCMGNRTPLRIESILILITLKPQTATYNLHHNLSSSRSTLSQTQTSNSPASSTAYPHPYTQPTTPHHH